MNRTLKIFKQHMSSVERIVLDLGSWVVCNFLLTAREGNGVCQFVHRVKDRAPTGTRQEVRSYLPLELTSNGGHCSGQYASC